MIPYIYIPTLQIGPITLQVWGLAVSLGIIVALFISKKILEKKDIKDDKIFSLAFWIIVGAFSGARLFHAVFYERATFLADPWEILRIWHGGLSSFGGFLGGTLAAFICFRKYKLPALVYADSILRAFPWGWAIGRVGCFLTHLHPGALTNSFLAVKYPGGNRFDLGLIESLNGLAMGFTILIAGRYLKKEGMAPAVGLVWYGVVRFFTDFLRAKDLPGSDARYWGLTPAQYGSILLCVGAIFILSRSSRARA